MPNARQYETVDEFIEYIRVNWDENFACYARERTYACLAGWDKEEFQTLYRDYVQSTQIQLNRGDDKTGLKGNPLEEISRYFLERGGIVTEITEIVEHQKWQVDGQGPLNKAAILELWESMDIKCGPHLYMEAKNHSEPIGSTEFAEHFTRMIEHQCNLGVMFSTSGYSIGKGQGIADRVHFNSYAKRYHLLLTFNSLREVVVEDKPPLAILTKSLLNTLNNSYANDSHVQEEYTKEFCQQAAKEEFERLFSNDSEN